jgi:hypothetical protein
VVYSLFSYHQKNLGGPGSSRGMLERIRVGLTIYIYIFIDARRPAFLGFFFLTVLRYYIRGTG